MNQSYSEQATSTVRRETVRSLGGILNEGRKHMCRSIKTLRRGVEATTPAEVESTALKLVRKVSGFTRTSTRNKIAFNQAVAEITGAAQRLLESVTAKSA